MKTRFERDFAYEKLLLVRTIATKKFEFDQIKTLEISKV